MHHPIKVKETTVAYKNSQSKIDGQEVKYKMAHFIYFTELILVCTKIEVNFPLN